LTRPIQKSSPILDIRQFIDDRPFGQYQLGVAVMCGLLVFMDGFDAQVMGYVAPALTAALHVTRLEFGRAISSGLFGMMIGALLCGPLADRFGRKPVLVGCALFFGLSSLLTATASSLSSLMFFRFITGLGLGGAMPNTIALTSEYSPKRVRATAVMLMFCGFSIGAAAGGVVSARLISSFGWPAVFIFGGILPCAIAVIAAAVLPESIRFLVVRGGDRKRIVRYLSRIGSSETPLEDAAFVIGETQTRAGVGQLFAFGRSTMTLLLWAMFFMNLLDLYFLQSWLPTVLSDFGIPVNRSIYITSLLQIGGVCGALLLGRLMDRLLSFGVLAWTYLAAGVAIFLVGESGASVHFLVVTVLAAGFFVIGGQTSSNALAAEYYPTAIRSTGVGWALGIGRVGSILGPYLGAMLLTPGVQARHVFWAAALPPLVAFLAALAARFTVSSTVRIDV
jgi:AAHS family 4-hydroxybenzoate transporter-like MFS transporter